MAEKPYKINDRRGTSSGNNKLVPAATHSTDRQQAPNLQYDTHRNITALGLSKLRDVSRFLFWKYPIVQGALLEQANLSVSHFIPQFVGEDMAWGDEAEGLMLDADPVFDVRGWPYDRASYLWNLILHTRIDGTYWTLLTESADGFPQVQIIPAHRIGGLMDGATVANNDNFRHPEGYTGTANPWAGSRIIAGAIISEYGYPLAYRVYDELGIEHVDISSRSLFPTFFPVSPDQFVGIPPLAVCAFDLQDVGETRDFEKLAQKAAARVTLIETNESGEAPPGVDLQLPDNYNTGGTFGTGLHSEVLEGGVYHYLKSNSGNLSTLIASRPTQNQQAYEDRLIRGCFYGMEWSADFTLDNAREGGASMRVIVEKINRTIEKNQMLAAKTMRRVDGWRISKWVKLGLLKQNPDWYKWDYQGPARVTADAKYDDDIDRERIKMGGMTYREWYGKRGKWWEDEVRQRIREQKFIEAEAEKEGVDANKVQMLTPNGNVSSNQSEEAQPQRTE